MIILGCIIAAVVLVGLYCVSIYNSLISLRNRYKNGFAQIDVQLKRRYDLIPNLVETAKGYLSHEKSTLEKVIAARNTAYTASQVAAQSPGTPDAMNALNGAEKALRGAMGQFLAVSENYPDLKGNQTMAQLSEELISTENKISFARQAYNDFVMQYNNSREVFPNTLLADRFNFTPATLLEIESPEERKAVKVSFQ